jgi:hypothetical protein
MNRDRVVFGSYCGAQEWRPIRITWKIDGQVVREEDRRIPDQPSTIRLNFWVPASSFPEAFDPSLRPASRAADNQMFFYDVDFVEVRALQQ